MRALSRFLPPLRRYRRMLALALLCTCLGALHAQATANDDYTNPPSRVARLSYVAGDLGILPAGAQNWSDADVNRPLTTGDRLSSSGDGLAELEFGGATLRLDHRTDVSLLDLNEQIAQIELSQGTLSLSVFRLAPGQSYEIDTPTVALVIDQPGRFRVDIGANGGSTRVTAFDGDATVYGSNNAQRPVHAGRSYRFVDSGLSVVAIDDIAGGDGFDAWVSRRDGRYARSDGSQYLPDGMVGTPDLREYGAWQVTGDFGPVWYPDDVGPDWAPYRDGHWAYIAPWGWTWIDAMPWGYAPYHYGRWVHTGRGWGWIPGPRDILPVYAPALVVFVGSVSVGIGPVGWFPLGPGEIYNPWYRCNRGYYTRINESNIRRDRRHDERSIARRIDAHYAHDRDNQPLRGDRYVNRDAPRGLTAMPGRDFAAGQAVQRHLLRDDRQLASAPVNVRGVALRPLPGNPEAGRSAHVRNLPLNGFRREVVARHAPPPSRIETSRGVAGPARAILPESQMRVLAPARGNGSRPDNGRAPAGARVNPPGGFRGTGDAPFAQRRVEGQAEPPRPYAPPSARYAHPVDSNGPAPRFDRQPRPGVSYIAPANRYRATTIPPGQGLPPAPRIEPAAGLGRIAPAQVDRQPNYTMPRPDSYRPNDAAPRIRAEPMQRNPVVMQEPRPWPGANQPPRQLMPPPRAVPPVRVEAPRPPPREAPAARREEPRRHDDGHPR
ncbi:MAG: hypothetical protein KGM46_07135 [Pseudomonadota bacterium]|nr:hypothetical protein [Xanthomonadaceae bacterium]MDE3210499.1 hypothetical protein [Pseudomonadota bacterium]